ncbi:MAG TPA: NUDIX hydrolase [Bacteroidetes bacterium]|nr:NUDIX hydrolase [Bacteroidota bacterium]
MMITMKKQILKEIESITGMNSAEKEVKTKVINWIKSGGELYRIKKPATPNKHLVSYFVVIDGEYLLLVDHINAEKWLPTGGHMEQDEHPQNTVIREVYEELKIKAEFLQKQPLLLTSTKTVGKTAGHTDVCLWYALKGNRKLTLTLDKSEFHKACWFHYTQIPANTDPHLKRFVEKFYAQILN